MTFVQYITSTPFILKFSLGNLEIVADASMTGTLFPVLVEGLSKVKKLEMHSLHHLVLKLEIH